MNYPNSQTRRGRVQGKGQICPTLTTENIPSVLEPWTWEVDGVTYLIRIRKLTPRECWRLMDFKDEDFDKAAEVNSNTQLYKQAGNSIVRNILCEVFNQLISEEQKVAAVEDIMPKPQAKEVIVKGFMDDGYCPECDGCQDDLAPVCRYCGQLLSWERWKEINKEE